MEGIHRVEMSRRLCRAEMALRVTEISRCTRFVTVDFMLPFSAALVVYVPSAPTTVHGAHLPTWKMSPPAPTVPPCPRAPAFPRCSPVRVFVVEGRKKPMLAMGRVRAGKRRWHLTMAGPVFDFRPRVLASLARAGCAGAHCTMPTRHH